MSLLGRRGGGGWGWETRGGERAEQRETPIGFKARVRGWAASQKWQSMRSSQMSRRGSTLSFPLTDWRRRRRRGCINKEERTKRGGWWVTAALIFFSPCNSLLLSGKQLVLPVWQRCQPRCVLWICMRHCQWAFATLRFFFILFFGGGRGHWVRRGTFCPG